MKYTDMYDYAGWEVMEDVGSDERLD